MSSLEPETAPRLTSRSPTNRAIYGPLKLPLNVLLWRCDRFTLRVGVSF